MPALIGYSPEMVLFHEQSLGRADIELDFIFENSVFHWHMGLQCLYAAFLEEEVVHLNEFERYAAVLRREEDEIMAWRTMEARVYAYARFPVDIFVDSGYGYFEERSFLVQQAWIHLNHGILPLAPVYMDVDAEDSEEDDPEWVLTLSGRREPRMRLRSGRHLRFEPY